MNRIQSLGNWIPHRWLEDAKPVRQTEAETFHFLWPERIAYDIQEAGPLALLNTLFWFCSSAQTTMALGGYGWPFHVFAQRPEAIAVVFVLCSCSEAPCIILLSLRFNLYIKKTKHKTLHAPLLELQYWSANLSGPIMLISSSIFVLMDSTRVDLHDLQFKIIWFHPTLGSGTSPSSLSQF